jgi:hypothetical protein
VDLSYKPNVLYLASLERITAARREFNARAYVESMYFSGLAVECILQAWALHTGAAADARHALPNWLAKCPVGLQDDLKGPAIREWSTVVASWDNGLRYLSFDGLLGYLRDKGLSRGISGGPPSVVRKNANDLLESAEVVHQKAVVQWLSFAKK